MRPGKIVPASPGHPFAPVLAIQPPVHGGRLQPVAEALQLERLKAEPLLNRRDLQPTQHLADLKTRIGQLQQLQKGGNSGIRIARIAVGNGAGQRRHGIAKLLKTPTKHGLNKRRVVLYIRAQHHHIARFQGGVRIEAMQ